MALLGYGSAVQNCLAAAAILETRGIRSTVADARFCKPLDYGLVRKLAKFHEVLITVEEGSIGGFGSHVAQFMALDGLLDSNLKVIYIYTYPSIHPSINFLLFLSYVKLIISCKYSGGHWYCQIDI